ncbi:bifunctional [glutamate--ammonia ligase]-adenylyl-L-tyrosine phosphorylase/[glutamate--ammonia-ligase] adenylyltransferase [Thiomicrorhabdus aquaedulcis]|uniref:bifunctional [glutamate--ammonia ligase]-adenylyl-L-tyrosine phosphorylase/[glutamate--ammonia-ligase] adenylyltransferase n=1 Tax=Thiomicrorhabdus aquaedulcis TaxID=2211106 RepID=UPI000FD937BC|nr:bifunctional [glutamate--ammonia ligase]-adenylyl-L-tyrosine phosphorylase/[glutamate--ammonia-ligase] adenylyltransferase [Thiomicrorhabdus aquaedulcis]
MYSLEQVQAWSLYVSNMFKRFNDLHTPEVWRDAWPERTLYNTVYQTAIASTDETELKMHLRVQRNRMMTRIAVRDLMGLASLEESMAAISDLADALVTSALDWHYERFCVRYGTPIGRESGKPQTMLVIGMGKLGGQELNFSSDIDLIFAYPEGGETQGASRPLANDQFFIRLGQALNKSLVEMTGDGFVYRVDMRLRPFGDGGPLAVSFAGLEHYYELHGRAWERYALVKARVMAGNVDEAQALFNVLRPFVYRRYVDFSAMDSLRELKQMIAAEVAKKGMHDNIKLGRGGIREIEFITQAFQLVHGGRDKTLQGRALLPMLEILCQHGFIDITVYQGLKEAYVFLRRAENRLQAWDDQQTHSLPKESHQQLMLANAMGFADYAAFLTTLNVHRNFVEAQFAEVFAVDEACGTHDLMTELWLSALDEADKLAEFSLSSHDADDFLAQLLSFKTSRMVQTLGKEGTERLNATIPLIMREVLQCDYSPELLKRVLAVVESVVKRSVYLVLLKENPQALKNLVKLCQVSLWVADMLVKYPALMDQLLDERTLYEPMNAQALQREVTSLLHNANGDEEQFMEEIRQWKHAQVFKVAAADITGNVPIMQVSDYLTWIAQAVLHAVVEFAWQLSLKKSGLPGGMTPDNQRNPFMVIGYGKLGGIELGYGSDLDIVFVYEGLNPSAQSINPSGKAVDNSIYFVRMGQKIISLMTTLMPAGVLYEVDTRLRPNGVSGMMVIDFDGFTKYIEQKAWNWEHQAFVRARAVVGDAQSVAHFDAFKQSFLQQARNPQTVRAEVVEMRQKMQASLDKSTAQEFDLKQGQGGIVDIEFMMQYLVLAFAQQYPQLSQFSDNVRILEAVKATQLLPSESVDMLTQAYKVYRSKYHRMALQNQAPMVSSECYSEERQAVVAVWKGLMLAG